MSSYGTLDQQSATLLDQAVQHLLRNEVPAAEQLVTRILLARPNDADALQLLGTVRYMQGRAQDAEQAYLRSLSVNRAQPRALLNLGHLMRPQGRLAEAAT